MADVLKRIGELRVVPVIALDSATDAAPLADALAAGGLPIAEVTFRTAAAAESIKAMAARGGVLVGAGTVLNVDTVKRAVDAGAQFIVSPGFNPKTVAYCVANNIPVTPGCATPSDIEAALDHGITTVKFFPAEAIGGMKLLKAISAPYGMMSFMPTGGIDAKNVAEYLKFPKVIACGGSWMVTKELLGAGDWAEVTRLSKEAVTLAKQARP
ncbi:MAG TPA: bifunctional 4-hydroxy-2-oxoglutarate aldolase/2-dehydro-3-deoxy-phosphogluconate aldolase [Tepidisphaeraceae bacterium]|nr:bifunctional 4-hydroxy-2-oxoglutarate aldolase/2-dehydro-3-deoxy-phosphogluconate aldolase [Tepidisphaeraceae bacterium]